VESVFVGSINRSYFDAILGLRLLYRFERLNHLEVIQKYPNVSFSQLYGAEHLLRMLGERNIYINVCVCVLRQYTCDMEIENSLHV